MLGLPVETDENRSGGARLANRVDGNPAAAGRLRDGEPPGFIVSRVLDLFVRPRTRDPETPSGQDRRRRRSAPFSAAAAPPILVFVKACFAEPVDRWSK